MVRLNSGVSWFLNESGIWKSQIIELPKSFQMILKSSLFPGYWTSKIPFLSLRGRLGRRTSDKLSYVSKDAFKNPNLLIPMSSWGAMEQIWFFEPICGAVLHLDHLSRKILKLSKSWNPKNFWLKSLTRPLAHQIKIMLFDLVLKIVNIL